MEIIKFPEKKDVPKFKKLIKKNYFGHKYENIRRTVHILFR